MTRAMQISRRDAKDSQETDRISASRDENFGEGPYMPTKKGTGAKTDTFCIKYKAYHFFKAFTLKSYIKDTQINTDYQGINHLRFCHEMLVSH